MLTKQHSREVLVFCFNWKKSSAEAHLMLEEVYGDNAPTDESCREWFRRFKNGDFNVEDKLRCGQKRETPILQPVNVRSNVAISVKTYLETLKWEAFPHPPYSLDVTPSYYYLFRSMAHGLAHQHFRSYKEVKKWINSWIASKDASFFRDGIRKLPERWGKS